MKNSGKMIMVPESTFNAMQQQPQQILQPSMVQMSNLDQEMNTVLSNPNLSTDLKLAEYEQLLRRYRFIRDKEYARPMLVQSVNEPPAPIPSPSPQEQQTIFPTNTILDSLPYTLQRKATLLLDYIRQNPKKFKLSERNEIIIDGNKLDGSNITDLVHEVVRNRVLRDIPGSKEFASSLQEINIPQEALATTDRLNLLQQPPSRRLFNTPPPLGVARDLLRTTPGTDLLLNKMKSVQQNFRGSPYRLRKSDDDDDDPRLI